MLKKKVISFAWLLVGFATIALLFIGASTKGGKLCKGINVEVTLKARQVFIDLQGIKQSIAEAGGRPGTPIGKVDLRSIETKLRQNPWIKDLKLYFDNNQVLQAELQESDPVARIFTVSGKTFYIDSGATYLPTNSNIVARIPVFTGFPSDKRALSRPDSALLAGIKTVANYILQDSFWNAFIAQINIVPGSGFEIMPVIGNQTIRIGNADDLPGKFDRLYSFYKQVVDRTGLDAFDAIDVQYAGQVVATRADKTAVKAAPATATAQMPVQAAISPPAAASVKKTGGPLPKKRTTPIQQHNQPLKRKQLKTNK